MQKDLPGDKRKEVSYYTRDLEYHVFCEQSHDVDVLVLGVI